MDADPSTPRPTRTPAASISHTRQVPEARIWLLHGQCVTQVPARASRAISAASKWMPCASQVRSVSQPQLFQVIQRPAAEFRQAERFLVRRFRQDACAAARRCARPARRWRCISEVVTLNGEHGASAICTIAPGDGSCQRAISRSLSARMVSSSCTTLSGGSPPSRCDRFMLPRVSTTRMPSRWAASASMSIASSSPAGKT